MGPMPILAPLMFPIEIISHLSRIVSLSFRLLRFNQRDDMFLMVLLMLVPLGYYHYLVFPINCVWFLTSVYFQYINLCLYCWFCYDGTRRTLIISDSKLKGRKFYFLLFLYKDFIMIKYLITDPKYYTNDEKRI